MKNSLELATSLILATTAILATGSIGLAQSVNRSVGVVAVSYSGDTISAVSAAIAVGKNSAAGTASITPTETAASAVAGGGTLRVNNPDTPNVGYEIGSDASLGTTPTSGAGRTEKIDSRNGTTQAVTVVIP